MGKRVIIFIHGIIGHPRFFAWLARLIPPEDDSVQMLLAGHGGSADDFARATMGQWQEQVDRQLDLAERQYEQVILVGHSMGALFCLQQLRKRSKIAALFLLAPPLRIRVRLSRQMEKIRTILRAKGKSSEELFGGALGVDPDPRFWKYIRWLPNYLALFREIRRTRESLRQWSRLELPCTVFLSAQDELVSLKSADELRAERGFELRILQNSSHFTFTAEEKQIVQDSFRELLNKTRRL